MAADRAKTIAIEWDEDVYVFKAGRFTYSAREDKNETQLSDGAHDSALNWIDLTFTTYLGYLDQQLNGGSSYTLANATVMPSVAAVGCVDVLNALLTQAAVYYYPKLEDNHGNVVMTKYQVISGNDEIDLMAAAEAGRFQPYVPVRLKVKTPLTAYPSWANR